MWIWIKESFLRFDELFGGSGLLVVLGGDKSVLRGGNDRSRDGSFQRSVCCLWNVRLRTFHLRFIYSFGRFFHQFVTTFVDILIISYTNRLTYLARSTSQVFIVFIIDIWFEIGFIFFKIFLLLFVSFFLF